jgi:hypothetical protein
VLRDEIGEGNRTQSNKLYGVTLQPGESRVFYVSAHPWLDGMNRRWQAIDAVYGATAGNDDVDGSGVIDGPVTNRDSRLLSRSSSSRSTPSSATTASRSTPT